MPRSAAWKRPGLVATAPVNAPRTWPNSSDSSRFSGMAPQLMVTNGPLARCDRLCSSRAISSLPVPVSPVISTEMSVAATFWTLRKTSCMRGDEPRISPKRMLLDAALQRAVVELQLVDEERVADEQRGLRREDRQHLQVRLVEQLGDVVVADVDDAQHVAALEQRHAHHRRQLEVHHRQRVLELVVAERVRDDERLAAS